MKQILLRKAPRLHFHLMEEFALGAKTVTMWHPINVAGALAGSIDDICAKYFKYSTMECDAYLGLDDRWWAVHCVRDPKGDVRTWTLCGAKETRKIYYLSNNFIILWEISMPPLINIAIINNVNQETPDQQRRARVSTVSWQGVWNFFDSSLWSQWYVSFLCFG